MATEAEQLHIDAPELLTPTERTRDTVFTALMWLVYLYLWVPLLSLAAWLFGIELAYDVMIRSGGAVTARPALLGYLAILGFIVVVVVLWSLTNRARFHDAPRRKAVAHVTDAAMIDWFGVTAEALADLRSSRCAAVDFDAEGRPSVRAARLEGSCVGDVTATRTST